MKPGLTGIAHLIAATGYSLKGLRACWKSESAFRQAVTLNVLLMAASFFLARSPEQWLLLTAPLLILLVTELLNSAVETIIDRIGPEFHEMSGRAKDLGSAAVFMALVLIALCWATVLWSNLFA